VVTGDRFHWYSSTGWIMWNCQVSGLLGGTTVCILDGSPAWPGPDARCGAFAHAAGATFVGAGAAFYASLPEGACVATRQRPPAALRAIGSTGSPLADRGLRDWIWQRECRPDGQRHLDRTHLRRHRLCRRLRGRQLHAAGGAGEMQCRCLGAGVRPGTTAVKPLVDEVGELVCTEPMPSMPLRFWNDEGDRRLRDSYFDMFPGVWRHGDWIRVHSTRRRRNHLRPQRRHDQPPRHPHGHRRALPRRGGSARGAGQPGGRPGVPGPRESWMALFVVLREGLQLDEALRRA
jgi:acetoacetyl-CoA synthetase